jgi:hypothetical protein
MKKFLVSMILVFAAGPQVRGVVFINEVFINPPGGADDTKEFVELQGTPGKSLDGYALAFVNGTQAKFYPLGSIPPIPNPPPEIDEFFSLDGLSLGDNGLLVIGIGIPTDYPTLLSDANFQNWNGIWNGGLDTVGKLQNDGSNTIMLIRNRPGIAEADPTNVLGLRWGKDIGHDAELITPVVDPLDSVSKDQFGDGNLDKGDPNNMGGNTLDIKGASTLGDVTDDIEIVDEVSYEHDRGWEYDEDGRGVDVGSPSNGLPPRGVHALDDPQGFNSDILSRVDYRTKGSGWTPVSGGTGEMGNGNNWQDTATEQWVRGESVLGASGQGSFPFYFFSNLANANPDAIQPYETNVPLWLDDASGTAYDFTVADTYQVMAGRINPLAITFIPGDSDRDGDCDADDIAKIVEVFGDDDWIFSNGFSAAPEGDSGDPSTQTRPWDVDATGNNGIEASDLQWTLNFQGDATGRIIGTAYDDSGSSTTGVALNSNGGVDCTVTTSVNVVGGNPVNALEIGDTIEVTVAGQVTTGANTTSGEENGIMQFVQDLAISAGGVLEVQSVTALGSFAKTRSALESLQGSSGDLGIDSINGYATSFTQGLTGAVDLYRVTLEAIGDGAADVTVSAAAATKFAASTPDGLKVGHTDSHGNPNSVAYPSALSFEVIGFVPADCDEDGDVDGVDFSVFASCFNKAGNPPRTLGCSAGQGNKLDFDDDGDVDGVDFSVFASCFNKAGNPPRTLGCPQN